MSTYKSLYYTYSNTLDEVSSMQDDHKFCGLYCDLSGGVDVFIHSSLINEFCCFLAWEKPTKNQHIKDTSHDDYEGWETLGWQVESCSDMEDYCEENNVSASDFEDITLSGVVVGKLMNTDKKEFYESLLSEWAGKYLR